MDNTERIDSIAVESANAFVDGAHVLQNHAIGLSELWLKSLAETATISRDLTKSLLKQSNEAQRAWRSYSNESVKDLNGAMNNGLSSKAAERATSK